MVERRRRDKKTTVSLFLERKDQARKRKRLKARHLARRLNRDGRSRRWSKPWQVSWKKKKKKKKKREIRRRGDRPEGGCGAKEQKGKAKSVKTPAKQRDEV